MKVYLIRHAESHYNIGQAMIAQQLGENYAKTEKYITHKFTPDLMDAGITDKGVQQCEEARLIMADKHIDVVVVSPLKRALETCWHIFKDHPSKPKIIVEPVFKEILQSNCDIGSKLEQSMKNYPTFDFSRIQNPKTWYVDTIFNPNSKKDALQYLSKLSEEDMTCSNKIGLRILQLIKDYHSKNQAPDTEEDMKGRHLLQKDHLKNNYKDKSVAVVSHSETLKHFIGWKIKNCEVKEYVIEID